MMFDINIEEIFVLVLYWLTECVLYSPVHAALSSFNNILLEEERFKLNLELLVRKLIAPKQTVVRL